MRIRPLDLTYSPGEKALVLLGLRSKTLKNHWFYGVFAQKCSKTIDFIVFSPANVSKMNVLSTLRSKTLIKCG